MYYNYRVTEQNRYKNKYIKFLKENGLYNQELLNYIRNRTMHIDYKDNELKEFIGCYPIIENNTIKDIRLCVPELADDISVAINIHEYIHLEKMYKYLNKEYYFNDDEEVLPVFYELLFLTGNNRKETDEYIDFLREYICENNNKEYVYALQVWDNSQDIVKRLLRRI